MFWKTCCSKLIKNECAGWPTFYIKPTFLPQQDTEIKGMFGREFENLRNSMKTKLYFAFSDMGLVANLEIGF